MTLIQNERNYINDMSKINISNRNIMFLFSPRPLPNHTIRPLIYSFNQGFMQIVHDSLTEKSVPNYITKSDIGNEAIVPDKKGIECNTRILSDNWTFLLMCDGTAIPCQDTYMHPSNYRILYIGIFLDEPINLTTYDAHITNPTFNMNAKLIITRKTIFKTMNIGGQRCSPSLFSDVLYTNYNSMIHNDLNLYKITPESISQAIDNEINEENICISPDNQIKYNSVKLNSLFSQPKKNLNSILSTVSDSVEEVYYDAINYSTVSDDMSFTHENISSTILENLYVTHNPDLTERVTEGIGLKTDIIMLFNEILNINPEIIVVRNNKQDQLSVIDTKSYIVPETVYSSLIEQCVPGLLLNNKLGAIALSYDSYSNNMTIHSAETIGENLDNKTIQMLVDGFIYTLRKEVFEIMKFQCGDFELHLHCSVYGSSIINLRFYDFNSLGQDDYIENVNTLGGMVSNMLGDENHVIHNGHSLLSLINNVSYSATSLT